MIIYGNKIKFDLKKYLATGHSISELVEEVENAGFDVILTPLFSYVGIIYGVGPAMDSASCTETAKHFANLCGGLSFSLAGEEYLWNVEEEDIIC